MCLLTQQLPCKPPVVARDGCSDVWWGVSEVDREDFGCVWCGEERGGEGEDALAIGRGALWEDDYDALRVAFKEGEERDELSFWRWHSLWRVEGAKHGLQERYLPDLASVWVRNREDRVEYRRKV